MTEPCAPTAATPALGRPVIGVDCGNIPWVEVDSHRWHFWAARGGFAHFPYHCPTCQPSIGPAGLFLADAQEHFDCDGHLMRWNGTAYIHASGDCAVCTMPAVVTNLATCRPGRAPTQGECDAALAGHQSV